MTTPSWLLADFVAGWVLGWLAVRDPRWALLPALSTVVLLMLGLAGRMQDLLRISSDLTPTAGAVGFGLLALWGVAWIPSLPWRVGAGTVLVPVVVTLGFWLGLVLFFLIFQIS